MSHTDDELQRKIERRVPGQSPSEIPARDAERAPFPDSPESAQQGPHEPVPGEAYLTPREAERRAADDAADRVRRKEADAEDEDR